MSKQLKCMMITDSQAQLQYKCVKKKQKKNNVDNVLSNRNWSLFKSDSNLV